MGQLENKYFICYYLFEIDFASLDAFIDTWAKGYNYSSMELYTDIIFKPEFTKVDLEKLFIWKNGMQLLVMLLSTEISFLSETFR
ncbi:MAG: hypothetical protein V9E96_12765 [Chitinophagaceae bacterium]